MSKLKNFVFFKNSKFSRKFKFRNNKNFPSIFWFCILETKRFRTYEKCHIKFPWIYTWENHPFKSFRVLRENPPCICASYLAYTVKSYTYIPTVFAREKLFFFLSPSEHVSTTKLKSRKKKLYPEKQSRYSVYMLSRSI